MPPPPETNLQPGGARPLVMLWAGVLTGPLLWLVDLQVSYLMATGNCQAVGKGRLLAVSLAVLLLTGGAGMLSWRHLRRTEEAGPRANESPGASRERFLAICGALISGFFCLLVIAIALPLLLLSPCDF